MDRQQLGAVPKWLWFIAPPLAVTQAIAEKREEETGIVELAADLVYSHIYPIAKTYEGAATKYTITARGRRISDIGALVRIIESSAAGFGRRMLQLKVWEWPPKPEDPQAETDWAYSILLRCIGARALGLPENIEEQIKRAFTTTASKASEPTSGQWSPEKAVTEKKPFMEALIVEYGKPILKWVGIGIFGYFTAKYLLGETLMRIGTAKVK